MTVGESTWNQEGPIDPLPSLFKMWLVGLLAGVVLFVGLSGPILAPLATLLSGGPPKLRGLTLDLNGQHLTLAPDQALLVRPLDHLRVLKIETNLLFDGGLTLEGQGFEAKPLLTGAKVDDLIAVAQEPKNYDLSVRRGPLLLGKVTLVPISLPLDWVLKAQLTEGAEKLALLDRAAALAPKNPQLLDQVLAAAQAAGNDKRASEALAERVNLVTSPSDLALLAELYERLGQAQKQAALLATLAKLEPEKEMWAARLLNLAEKVEDPSLRVSALKNVAETGTGPRSATAAKRLGLTYAESGKWAEAAKAYEEAARQDPQDVNVFQNLATVYDRLGQPQKRLEAIQAALKLKPGDLGLLQALAAAQAKLGQTAKRLETLREMARLKPQDVDLLKEIARAQTGPEAAAAWEGVLKIAPQDQEALVALTKLLQGGGPSERLLQTYLSLAASKPNDPVILYNLGLVQAGLKRPAEAEESFRKARALNPKDADILAALLEAQRAQNKTEAAAETAALLLELKPGDADLYQFLARSLAKDQARLEKILEKGVKANPKSADLWKILALTRLSLKDAKGAAQALAQAVALNPADLDNRLRLAKLYEANGQTKEAVAQYQALIDKEPAKLEHRLRLAKLHEEAGQLKEALTQYEAILEKQPDNEAAAEARLNIKMKLLQQGQAKEPAKAPAPPKKK